MSERIKDLALEVISQYMPLDAWAFNDRELLEFATMIINDCITVARSSTQGADDGLMNSIEVAIKTHFELNP